MNTPNQNTKLLVKTIACTPEEDLHPDDKDFEPYVTVQIEDDVPVEDWADCALDVYHDNITIKVLDDFEFKVYKGNDELTPNDSHDSYSLKHKGHLG